MLKLGGATLLKKISGKSLDVDKIYDVYDWQIPSENPMFNYGHFFNALTIEDFNRIYAKEKKMQLQVANENFVRENVFSHELE